MLRSSPLPCSRRTVCWRTPQPPRPPLSCTRRCPAWRTRAATYWTCRRWPARICWVSSRLPTWPPTATPAWLAWTRRIWPAIWAPPICSTRPAWAIGKRSVSQRWTPLPHSRPPWTMSPISRSSCRTRYSIRSSSNSNCWITRWAVIWRTQPPISKHRRSAIRRRHNRQPHNRCRHPRRATVQTRFESPRTLSIASRSRIEDASGCSSLDTATIRSSSHPTSTRKPNSI